jgi:hypothetical protein
MDVAELVVAGLPVAVAATARDAATAASAMRTVRIAVSLPSQGLGGARA